jgi:phage terminase large subunit-like protein
MTQGKNATRSRKSPKADDRSKSRKTEQWVTIAPEDVTAAQIIHWIENTLYVPEGRLIGQPIRLAPWQKDEIVRIYDNPSGTRRAILSFARKNGKTALSACLLLVHLCGPKSIPNSNLYSTAQSREQASLIFTLASKIIRMSPVLQNQVHIKDTHKILEFPYYNVVFRALSAEASTAYGLSPVFVVHDELGQVRGPRSELYEALETSTGAQSEPLSIIISTQAPSDNDLLSILIDDALSGEDPRIMARVFSAPMDLDPFSEEAIRLANPAFGDFLNPREVLQMAAEAKRMPAREAQFRNLVLNQRVEAKSPFVSHDVWGRCGDEPEDIQDVPVYAGLDLSEVKDLTALVLIGYKHKIWNVHPTFWLPQEGIHEKARNDRVPYDMWAQRGFLQLTPGRSVSYEYVAAHLRNVFDAFDIRKLAFDAWNMRHLKPWLITAGFNEQEIEEKFVEFRQGTQSMSPALRDLEQIILEEGMAHGDHPVLGMCAANSVVEGKDSANRKLSKAKSSGRIDGMVALAMAFGVAPLKAPAIDVEALIG